MCCGANVRDAQAKYHGYTSPCVARPWDIARGLRDGLQTRTLAPENRGKQNWCNASCRTGAAEQPKSDYNMPLRSTPACVGKKLIITCSALHAGMCGETARGRWGAGVRNVVL